MLLKLLYFPNFTKIKTVKYDIVNSRFISSFQLLIHMVREFCVTEAIYMRKMDNDKIQRRFIK